MKKITILVVAALMTMFVNADVHYNEYCNNCGNWSSRGVTYTRGKGWDIWGNYYWDNSRMRVTGINPCPYCHAEYEGDEKYKRAHGTSDVVSNNATQNNATTTQTTSQTKHYYVIAYDIVDRMNITNVIKEDEFKGEFTDFNSAWDALLKKNKGSVIVLRATWIMQ